MALQRTIHPNHAPNPACRSFSFPNTSSMRFFVSSKVWRRYAGKEYFVARLMLGSRYFTTDPSDIVKIRFPPHFTHFPISGGLLNLSLHLTHLNCCIENFLRLPLMSLMKCFSMTSLATSEVFTARIRSASSIWPRNFSSIEGRILYAEHVTP